MNRRQWKAVSIVLASTSLVHCGEGQTGTTTSTSGGSETTSSISASSSSSSSGNAGGTGGAGGMNMGGTGGMNTSGTGGMNMSGTGGMNMGGAGGMNMGGAGGMNMGGAGGMGGASTVVINEIESSSGNPGDWVELYNAGTTTEDISGYVFKDSNDANVYVVPMGTKIAPQAYFVLQEAQFAFGLGENDAARLFYPGGVAIIDSFSWTEHAQTTLGRCPNGVGMFAVTMSSSKGAPNDCVW